MSKATKKPATIDFVTWNGEIFSEEPAWLIEALNRNANEADSLIIIDKQVQVKLREGGVTVVNPNDKILMGVNGEIYPCHPDIFDKTYVVGENAIVEEENPLKKASDLINKDPELRMAYVANIAMAFKDHYSRFLKPEGYKPLPFESLHLIANEAAVYFMDLLLSEPGESMPLREPMGVAAVGEVYPSKENTVYAVIEPDLSQFGGANEYVLRHSIGFINNDHKYSQGTTHLKFVRRLESGEMVPGLQSEQLVLALKDRTYKLNKKFPSPQNEKMIEGLDMFLEACKERIDDRMQRGVMGDLKK